MSRRDKRGRDRCPHRPVSVVRRSSRDAEDSVPYVEHPQENPKKAAPRDCLQSRRAAKQGMSQAHSNHRRAAAGGESKHYHKSAPAPVKFPPSFPSGWLPRGPGPQPRRTLVTFLRGKVTRPQAKHPHPPLLHQPHLIHRVAHMDGHSVLRALAVPGLEKFQEQGVVPQGDLGQLFTVGAGGDGGLHRPVDHGE